MNYIRVKDKDNLARDINSSGIVNTDSEAYKNYVENYKRKINESKKIENIQNEVNEIKSDIEEIKDMMKIMLNSIKTV